MAHEGAGLDELAVAVGAAWYEVEQVFGGDDGVDEGFGVLGDGGKEDGAAWFE